MRSSWAGRPGGRHRTESTIWGDPPTPLRISAKVARTRIRKPTRPSRQSQRQSPTLDAGHAQRYRLALPSHRLEGVGDAEVDLRLFPCRAIAELEQRPVACPPIRLAQHMCRGNHAQAAKGLLRDPTTQHQGGPQRLPGRKGHNHNERLNPGNGR